MIEITTKKWQDMTEEEREVDRNLPYNSWTIQRMFDANNDRLFVDQQTQSMWVHHHGMTVGELVRQLLAYHPDQPVVLRRESSWNFVRSDSVGIKCGLILPQADEEGEEDRANIMEGKVPSMEVVCLYADGYDPETVDPYEAQEYMEESE
jgi:hypothetical protein